MIARQQQQRVSSMCKDMGTTWIQDSHGIPVRVGVKVNVAFMGMGMGMAVGIKAWEWE